MIPLRCWARLPAGAHGRADEYCHRDAGHEEDEHADGRAWHWKVWPDEHCAPDAGPNGRETAALRIWEIGTRLDLVALRRSEHSQWFTMLRAIAARLLAGTEAARADLAAVEEAIDAGEHILAMPETAPAAMEALMRETIDALSLAADILRPFAEGRRG